MTVVKKDWQYYLRLAKNRDRLSMALAIIVAVLAPINIYIGSERNLWDITFTLQLVLLFIELYFIVMATYYHRLARVGRKYE